ncbi:acyl-CoA thioesterase [Pseudoduganella namucuonensis]|uniref:Acyl-CoA thioester hydrolase n=1 Tax=Pseudoduganella namucuonensis TaxID=1035707 RepID=A0A1I7KDT8_9BURK|nr:thioesterase family protein [Pseudoduganella namucuonensis]SFU95564.1 acyl-CoA thioester hydrolase [Pseudoduganella namucuonensis]
MTLRDADRSQFPHFQAIPTRWMDNDIYGHVNNVVYYSYFDTAVNQFLIEKGVLDIHQGGVVGFVVDSGCAYFSSISFPDVVHAGVRVGKLGNSSVRYEIALYRNDDALPCAAGHFVHVYVERGSNRSVPIPASTRAVLETLSGDTPSR